MNGTCGVITCREPAWRIGLCMKHSQRVKAYGTIHPATSKLNVERYLWSFVRVPAHPDGCWIWTGDQTPDNYGYGGFLRRLTPGRSSLAHRAVFELYHGEISPGLVLDHLCRVTLCVKPDHLEPVTNAENIRRGLHGLLRSHCSAGHPLTVDGVYSRPGTARRECRECKRGRAREWARITRARKKVAA